MVKVIINAHDLNGRNVGQIVNLESLDGDATLHEAIKRGYVTGKEPVLASIVEGVLTAMVDGVNKDGNGRKIDGYLSINAYLANRLADICDEINRKNAKINLRARMLKEFKIDTSGWTIIVEGSTGVFQLEVVTTGERLGEVVTGKDVLLNGKNLTLGEGDTVSFSVPEMGVERTVSASNLTSNASRITVARDGWQDLFDEDYDGKTVVWTVKIGNKVARKTAVVRYSAE